MRIAVIGGGGREHTIIKKIKLNPEVTEIFALPGNGGIAADATCVDIGAKDLDGIVRFCTEEKIDYVIVAPDDPLVLGCVDRLEEVGIPCFGPRANAAIVEGSKVFSKNLMKKYGIPTAAYATFDDADKAIEYLQTCPIPTVVKADGLALGKGVIIAQTRDEAKAAVRSMKDPTPKGIDQFIERLIRGKLEDGQLSDCELSLRNIDQICEAFSGILKGVYHERIEYPKVQKYAVKDTAAAPVSEPNPDHIKESSAASAPESAAKMPDDTKKHPDQTDSSASPDDAGRKTEGTEHAN